MATRGSISSRWVIRPSSCKHTKQQLLLEECTECPPEGASVLVGLYGPAAVNTQNNSYYWRSGHQREHQFSLGYTAKQLQTHKTTVTIGGVPGVPTRGSISSRWVIRPSSCKHTKQQLLLEECPECPPEGAPVLMGLYGPAAANTQNNSYYWRSARSGHQREHQFSLGYTAQQLQTHKTTVTIGGVPGVATRGSISSCWVIRPSSCKHTKQQLLL